MPFLFDRDVSDDVAKPRGRRIYNKGGHELLNDAKVPSGFKDQYVPVFFMTSILQEATYQPQADAGLVQPLGKVPARSGSISAHLPVGFSSTGHSTAVQKLPKDPNRIKNAPKSTMQVIRDGANIDLVHVASTKQSPTQINSLGTAFLKPSGVDDPAGSSGAQGSTVIPPNNDIVVKARSQVKVTLKREREQEVVSEHNDKEKKKRKKKKQLVE